MSAPLAAPGEMRCGERYDPHGHGRCARPFGHAGAHLSAAGRYWQAQGARS